jgi:N-acetylglucosamine-6-phosphate deacetylase
MRVRLAYHQARRAQHVIQTSRHTLRSARVVTPQGVLDPGFVAVEDDRIVGVGPGDGPEGGEGHDLSGRWLIPGLIDVHVHGGAGGDFMNPGREAHATALMYHGCNGTTSLLATTVTASAEELLAAVDSLAESIASPSAGARIAGIHLEGPFISEERRGAQNPRWIRNPDASELERLIDASNDTIRMVTVAPERPGGEEFVRFAVERGIVVAAGHSDASYDELMESVDWGVSHCTHSYNGMRGLHHREPGLVGGLLDVDELTCELIADGLHVHPAAARLLHRVKGSGRLLFITDATAAAGMPDGTYELGGIPIDVRAGRARVRGDGAMAGSTLTMGAALRNGVAMLRVGVPEAVPMTSTTPAKMLGLGDEIGAIAEGRAADLVVLGDDLGVEKTMVRGAWM